MQFFVYMLFFVVITVKTHEDRTIDETLLYAIEDPSAADFLHSNDSVLVEIDVILSAEEWQKRIDPSRRQKRGGLVDKNWPQATVMYKPFSDDFTPKEKQAIKNAFFDYERYTCLKFQQRNYGHLMFVKGGACWSDIGYQRKLQMLSLSRACLVHHSTIVHELGHAMGLEHEQRRPDRDDYIRVDKDNIDKGNYYNFGVKTFDEVNTYDIPYDYLSVMHYGQKEFAVDMSKPSIYTLDERYQYRIGQVGGLSFEDIQLLNLKYGCNAHCGNKRCPKDGFLSKDCTCWCKRSNEFGEPVAMCETGRRVPGGKPGGGIGECRDMGDENCQWYVDNNHCENPYSKKHIMGICRKTCGWCDKGDVIINGKVIVGPTRPQGNRHNNNNINNSNNNTNKKPKNICKNADITCGSWAGYGFCTNPHHGYVKDKCPRSCGYCGNGVYTGIECQYRTLDMGCKPGQVLRIHDAVFGRQDLERCTNGVMDTVNCRAPDSLSKVKARCEGQNHCQILVDSTEFQDQCPSTYKYLMVDFECVRPGSSSFRGGGQVNKCADIHPKCGEFVAKGGCDKNPNWMRQHCKKSCQACDSDRVGFNRKGQCKDTKPAECKAWADRNMCHQNRIYMRDNCPKSCDFCT